MPQSATPFEQGDAKWSVTLAEQPSVSVIIDDHRRFHELQEPPPGRNRTRLLLCTCDPSCAWGGEVRVDSMKFPRGRNPKPGKVGRRNPAPT
jgi:hypothetical protein